MHSFSDAKGLKMRVGLLTYGLDRRQTGIGRYAVELARAMSDIADDFELFLVTAGGAGPLDNTEIPQIPLTGCRLLPALMTLGNVMLRRVAYQHRLDILHDTTGVTPFLFGGGPAKTVVTVHDIIPWSFAGVSTRLDTLIYRHWLPRRLPKTDAIVTVSQASKQDILKYIRVEPDHVNVVYSGVAKTYQPSNQQQIDDIKRKYEIPNTYILYVGSVEERKNLERVLTSFAQIKEKGVTQQLVIVGPQKWKYEQIIQTLNTLNLNQDVIFTGYVDEGDLPVLYSGADLFVFPSLYEGFGLPVIEAMACGTPVVTSNVSSLPEVAGEAALQVDPYNVEDIANAMYQVLTDPALQKTLSEKGLAHVEQFKWEHSARATKAIYQRLCAQ